MFIQDLSENQIQNFIALYGVDHVDHWSDWRFQTVDHKFRCRFNFDFEQWYVYADNRLVGYVDYSDEVDEFTLEQYAIELAENNFSR